MKATQIIGQALVTEHARVGFHYQWEHDVEGDVIRGSFHFPVLLERGDRVKVELEGESSTLTVQQVVYDPVESVIELRLG